MQSACARDGIGQCGSVLIAPKPWPAKKAAPALGKLIWRHEKRLSAALFPARNCRQRTPPPFSPLHPHNNPMRQARLRVYGWPRATQGPSGLSRDEPSPPVGTAQSEAVPAKCKARLRVMGTVPMRGRLPRARQARPSWGCAASSVADGARWEPLPGRGAAPPPDTCFYLAYVAEAISWANAMLNRWLLCSSVRARCRFKALHRRPVCGTQPNGQYVEGDNVREDKQEFHGHLKRWRHPKTVEMQKFIISESDQGESPCPLECPQERGRPVCASDGKLYKSLCTFQKARCRDSSLDVLPRFRCGGAAHREPNNTNLTRCLEDRAAALSQSRRQMHATYIPECAEDGTFLQVQCHKQTGYCWCSSPEGKPISGTSVLNETPNCTGSYTVRTSWQDPNSSRREEGTRPRPTQPSPLPHKQEGGTSLPFLMPIIIPDFRPNQTVKPAQGETPAASASPEPASKESVAGPRREYPPSCEQERREAIDEARQHQQEGTFIPECEGDGTYKAVQCHQATGYCWCVRVDTGRPVPGTSTRSFPPDCEADEATKSAELASLFRDRTLPGCPGAKKAEFLSSLTKALASDMLQSRMMPIPYQRFPDSLVGPSLEERAVRWQFVRLDKDFSNSISERELRPLKLYMKKNTRPKRCVRKFLDYCDLNENKLISLHELKGCLGLS